MVKIYVSPSLQVHNLYFDGKTTECEYCNRVADILVPSLERYGYFSCRRNRTDMGLLEAIADSNAWKADLHVSIHTNAAKKNARGCEVYAGWTEASKRAAQCIYEELSAITPVSDRGINSGKSAGLAEITKTNAPAVLAEISFHDSDYDGPWLLANVDNVAAAIEKGICRCCGVDYMVPAAEHEAEAAAGLPVDTSVMYKVQAGAFSQRANAEKLAARIKAAGFDCFIVKVNS